MQKHTNKQANKYKHMQDFHVECARQPLQYVAMTTV